MEREEEELLRQTLDLLVEEGSLEAEEAEKVLSLVPHRAEEAEELLRRALAPKASSTLEDSLIGRKRRPSQRCPVCGKNIPPSDMVRHMKKRHRQVKLFYGNHTQPWGNQRGYIMIHRDSCSHMSHVTVERGAGGFRYVYGSLEEVYLWAIRRSELGLPIYHCTQCNPPTTSPFPKDEEGKIRRKYRAKINRFEYRIARARGSRSFCI